MSESEDWSTIEGLAKSKKERDELLADRRAQAARAHKEWCMSLSKTLEIKAHSPMKECVTKVMQFGFLAQDFTNLEDRDCPKVAGRFSFQENVIIDIAITAPDKSDNDNLKISCDKNGKTHFLLIPRTSTQEQIKHALVNILNSSA